MARGHANSSRSGVLGGLSSIGTRAAAATVRPLAGPVNGVVDRLLDSGELERLLASPRFRAAVKRVGESDGARMLVDAFFDSGLFERLVDRLLASEGLWRLVDEIADSPAVTEAISQQGLGFADQLGSELRRRSRRADDRLERVARRLIGRRSVEPGADSEAAT